jgi:hypothetical protein
MLGTSLRYKQTYSDQQIDGPLVVPMLKRQTTLKIRLPVWTAATWELPEHAASMHASCAILVTVLITVGRITSRWREADSRGALAGVPASQWGQ